MLKKVNVRDIRLGMFINELCGNWMDHPFWKRAFLLEKQKDLDSLQNCSLEEVWIDTEKGLDVETDIAVADEGKKQQKAETALQEAAVSEKKAVPHVAVHEEVQRAQKIHVRAKKEVAFMFKESRLGKVLETGEAVTLVDEIIQSVSRNPGAFLSLARLKNKDDYLYLHSVAVCALMVALGRQLDIEGDALKSIGMAGLLHDVGKVMIPDEVLNKPGRLTDEEFEIIKSHPQVGWKILNESFDVDDIVLDVCLHHHEQVDGMGYPDKLSGEALTLFARIGAVCDIYDALTSDRPNKRGMSPADAIRKMAEWQGGHFDKTVFHAFVKTVGIYPTGTLVKLKSGRLGVVADQSAKSLTTPVVKVFFSTKANAPIFPELIDLSKVQDSIASVEDPASWKLDLKMMTGI